MKVYGFIVKKVLKNKVQIREKSFQKAMQTLIELLEDNGKVIFEDLKEDEQFYEIKLTRIADDFEEDDDEILDEENEEIEDDLPTEYNEIVCEKCGNCIPIDEDFMS